MPAKCISLQPGYPPVIAKPVQPNLAPVSGRIRIDSFSRRIKSITILVGETSQWKPYTRDHCRRGTGCPIMRSSIKPLDLDAAETNLNASDYWCPLRDRTVGASWVSLVCDCGRKTWKCRPIVVYSQSSRATIFAIIIAAFHLTAGVGQMAT